MAKTFGQLCHMSWSTSEKDALKEPASLRAALPGFCSKLLSVIVNYNIYNHGFTEEHPTPLEKKYYSIILSKKWTELVGLIIWNEEL